MLQVFHMDVEKVDQDIACVAMVVHVCCKLMFSMFHLFFFLTYDASMFYLDVAYVFTNMMQVFYLDVAYVYNGFKCFCKCFRRMFQIFLFVFERMLQLLHLDVSKLDRVLHRPHCLFCYLASVSGAGRRKRSKLAQANPTCLRVDATGETWPSRHKMWDRGQRRGHPDRGEHLNV
jgi:hypothetical protein